MKFVISMKTPDAVNLACEQATTSYTDDDEKVVDEDKIEELEELCSKWFKYGECVNIEIDTETGTAKVLTV